MAWWVKCFLCKLGDKFKPQCACFKKKKKKKEGASACNSNAMEKDTGKSPSLST